MGTPRLAVGLWKVFAAGTNIRGSICDNGWWGLCMNSNISSTTTIRLFPLIAHALSSFSVLLVSFTLLILYCGWDSLP